MTKYG